LSFGELAHERVAIADVGGLARYERPLPAMNEYDLLLGDSRPAAEVAR
jgi:hypothetical protein